MKKARDPRLDSDADFILSPKHGNSMRRLLDENPEGVPDSTICKVLDMSQDDLKKTYDSAILKLSQAVQQPESLTDDDDV